MNDTKDRKYRKFDIVEKEFIERYLSLSRDILI